MIPEEVEDVVELIDMKQFLEDVGADSTYGQCHQAIVWLAREVKKAGLPDWNLYLCTGAFANYDHSWITIETIGEDDEQQFTVIDMTVDQFAPFEMPYVGPYSPGYELRDSIVLCDRENIMNFVENLG